MHLRPLGSFAQPGRRDGDGCRLHGREQHGSGRRGRHPACTHPISVARRLSRRHTNSFLIGHGAARYAQFSRFEMHNMLSDRARKRWELEAAKTTALESASPYQGHDMVGAISLDAHGSMVAGTFTSRLFMKEPGRVGDSPLPGSDFYADSAIGGAAATRLGEGIMKECLSYRIVALTGSGLSPQEACDS